MRKAGESKEAADWTQLDAIQDEVFAPPADEVAIGSKPLGPGATEAEASPEDLSFQQQLREQSQREYAEQRAHVQNTSRAIPNASAGGYGNYGGYGAGYPPVGGYPSAQYQTSGYYNRNPSNYLFAR